MAKIDSKYMNRYSIFSLLMPLVSGPSSEEKERCFRRFNSSESVLEYLCCYSNNVGKINIVTIKAILMKDDVQPFLKKAKPV